MAHDKIWPDHLFQGNATKWIADKALAFCKGDGIDFGAGKWCLPGAIPVDQATYFSLEDFDPNSLDFVYSSHCLEHIRAWKQTLCELVSKLKPHGIIYLYLPHEISPWTGWRKHKWVPKPEDIIDALDSCGVDLLTHSTAPDAYQSFFVVGRKREPSAIKPKLFESRCHYTTCAQCGLLIEGVVDKCPRCNR